MHTVIKNKDGQLLKYLYANSAVFNNPNSRAFRVYTFAKNPTVLKTLEKLKEWGHEGCVAVEVSEEEHEKFNSVEQRKEKERKDESIRINTLIEDVTDEYSLEYLPQCRICSRACKQRKIVTIYGRCPQLDVA